MLLTINSFAQKTERQVDNSMRADNYYTPTDTAAMLSDLRNLSTLDSTFDEVDVTQELRIGDQSQLNNYIWSFRNFAGTSGFDFDSTGIKQYTDGVEVLSTDASGTITLTSGSVISTMSVAGFDNYEGARYAAWNNENSYMADNKDTTWIYSNYIETPTVRIKNNNGRDRWLIDTTKLEYWHSGIKKIMTDTTGFIYHKMPDAFLYRSTDTTINITQNIWYKFGPLSQKGVDGITVQRDSVQLIYPGDYTVKYILSLTGLNNEVWEGGIFKNSVLEEPSQFNKTITTDEKQLVVETEVTSDGNDWVTFKVRNTTDNDDITIRKIAVKIVTNHLTIQ